MKKEYMKPTIKVVQIRHQPQLLAGSDTLKPDTNLDPEDDLDIEDTPQGDWGR